MNFKKLSFGLTVAGLAFVTLTPKAQAFQIRRKLGISKFALI